MGTYTIKDWDSVFEDFRSREVGALTFIKFPLRQDSESFRRLMRSRAGQAAYGVFCAVVQIAARCPKRGVLSDDRGPYNPARIADRIGASQSSVDDAITLLTSPQIGWLLQDGPIDTASSEHRSGIEPMQPDSTKTTPNPQPKHNQNGRACVSPEEIYAAYPRKEAKADALKAIGKAAKIIAARFEGDVARAFGWLLERVKAYAASGYVRTVQPDYIPHPATWMNKGRYDDPESAWQERLENGNGRTGGGNQNRGLTAADERRAAKAAREFPEPTLTLPVYRGTHSQEGRPSGSPTDRGGGAEV